MDLDSRRQRTSHKYEISHSLSCLHVTDAKRGQRTAGRYWSIRSCSRVIVYPVSSLAAYSKSFTCKDVSAFFGEYFGLARSIIKWLNWLGIGISNEAGTDGWMDGVTMMIPGYQYTSTS